MSKQQIVKIEFLEQYFGNNNAAKRTFLVQFKTTTGENIGKLNVAVEKGDIAPTILYAHNLCSALKYLGVFELSAFFSAIEKELESGVYDWEIIRENFATASKMYAMVIADVDIFIEQLK